MKTIKVVEIYFENLCKEKQNELLKLFKVNRPEDMNWGLFPLTLIEEPELEDNENNHPE